MRFVGPGAFPMDPDRNSVHVGARNASGAPMRGNFMPQIMLFVYLPSQVGGPVLRVPSQVGDQGLGCQEKLTFYA